MLRHIILAALSLAACSFTRATEVADTVITITRPETVSLTETGRIVRFNVRGSSADSTYRLDYAVLRSKIPYSIRTEQTDQDSHKKKNNKCNPKDKRNKLTTNGVYVGFVSALDAPSGMNTDMASSIEVGFEPLAFRHYSRDRKRYFSIGLSFDWRNYRLTDRTRFIKDKKENVVITSYPEDASRIHSSRIKTFSLGIPFRYGFCMGKSWTADIAAILNFNTYASVQSSYGVNDDQMIPGETVGHHVDEFYADIHQQKVTVDFMARIHWKVIGVYAKYSPCRVLNSGYGPKFTPLSVGLSVTF